MKFEEFLQDNKDELGVDEINSELWDRIEKSTINKENSAISSNRFFWIGILFTFFTGCLIGTIWLFTSVQQQEANFQTAELKAEIKEIKTLLKDRNVNHKIQGIQKANFVHSSGRGDLTRTLLRIIERDKNLNVRFAALRALKPYRNTEEVKVRLIQLMTKTESDNLRLRLISFLSHDPDKEMEGYIEKLLDDKPENQVLRRELEAALEQVRTI